MKKPEKKEHKTLEEQVGIGTADVIDIVEDLDVNTWNACIEAREKWEEWCLEPLKEHEHSDWLTAKPDNLKQAIQQTLDRFGGKE